MLIHELGGEFKLLEHILRSKAQSSIVVNNGDDAAVIRCGNELLAVSVDAFVAERHFSFDYFSPEQVGIKCVEGSASDIVAMGGAPQFVFVSIVIPSGTPVEKVKRIYDGMYQACERIGAIIVGGDTTSGAQELILSLTVVGKIADVASICTRGGAKPGDLLFVSGDLGESSCGFELLKRKMDGFPDIKKRHLEPRCRVDLVSALAPVATSMIDISDGLSSETHHLAAQSKCGAIVREHDIPLSADLKLAAKTLSLNPYELALHGGEDFELLYTVDPADRAAAVGTEVGVMTAEPGVFLDQSGQLSVLKSGGFDHF